MLFLSFFFQMPLWCYRKGSDILSDCSVDQNRVEYYTMKLLNFDMWPAYYISWSCQLFLVANQIFALVFATQNVYRARVVFLVVCLIGDVVTGILFMKGMLLRFGLNPYFKIAFIIMYRYAQSHAVRRSAKA